MSRFCSLVLCAVFICTMGSFAFGQGATATITGLVTDPQGSAIPGAQITVINTATNAAFKLESGAEGEWTLPAMQAGTYHISVAKAGFKTANAENVTLNTGVPVSVNMKLEIGQTSEVVEVTGGAELVQSTNATLSATISSREVNELPFSSRNAVELMVTKPGTQTPTNPRSSSINGLPKGALNITIDGMNTQDNMLKSSDGFFSYIMPFA